MRARLSGALVAAAAALIVPAGAAAQLPASASVTASQSALSWTGAASVTYELALETEAEPASFEITWGVPGWPESAGTLLSSPLRFEALRLAGPGTAVPVRLSSQPFLPIGPCTRGIDDIDGAFLKIPAASRSSLFVTAAMTAAPWQGMDYRTRFFMDLSQSAGSKREIPAPPISLTGPFGVQVLVRKARPPQAEGSTPSFKGSTIPAAPRRTIKLRAIGTRRALTPARWKSAGSFPLGHVRTDRRGRFSVPATEGRKFGAFRVMTRTAATASQPADWGCGPYFSVKGDPPPKHKASQGE